MGPTVPKARRERRFTCINMKQESNKQRECDVAFYLDVMTPLVLSMAKFVFPTVNFAYSAFNAGTTLLGLFH